MYAIHTTITFSFSSVFFFSVRLQITVKIQCANNILCTHYQLVLYSTLNANKNFRLLEIFCFRNFNRKRGKNIYIATTYCYTTLTCERENTLVCICVYKYNEETEGNIYNTTATQQIQWKHSRSLLLLKRRDIVTASFSYFHITMPQQWSFSRAHTYAHSYTLTR